MICAHWTVSDNFGDKLAPWIINKLQRQWPVVWVTPQFTSGYYVLGGSILNHAGPTARVWGAGIATLTDGINTEAQLLAVRGPLTRARALSCGAKCPPIYGDPGFVLPLLYQPKSAKTHDIGYVPHYVDQFRVHQRHPQAKIINVLDPIEKVIEDIHSCRKIASSSLHGLVVAMAYKIPSAWVRWSDSIGGDGTKYRDVFMSCGLDVPNAFDSRESSQDISDRYFVCGTPDVNALREACPIK